jgi:hypothetical protein
LAASDAAMPRPSSHRDSRYERFLADTWHSIPLPD